MDYIREIYLKNIIKYIKNFYSLYNKELHNLVTFYVKNYSWKTPPVLGVLQRVYGFSYITPEDTGLTITAP